MGLDPGRENSAWNPEIRPDKVINPITWCDWLTVTIQSREVTVNGNRTVKSNVPQYLVSVRKFGLVTGDLFSERWNRILNVDPPPLQTSVCWRLVTNYQLFEGDRLYLL